MANAKSRKKSGSGSKRQERAFWYKLLLIPYAFLMVWLMGLFDLNNLDFVKRFMDYWGRNEYTLNFVCLFVSAAGLLLLIFGPTKYRIVTAMGLVMFLMPVWFQPNPAQSEAKAISDIRQVTDAEALVIKNWNFRVFLFEIVTALWAFLLVRGNSETEWIKPVVALVILAVYAYMYLSGVDSFDIYQLLFQTLPLILLTGFVMDAVQNGFSLQSLFPVAIMALANLFDIIAPESMVHPEVFEFWGIAALSAASIIVLLVRHPLKNRSLGGIMTLLCLMLNVGVFLAVLVWKVEIPKLL